MRAQLLSVKKSDIQQIYTQYSEPVLGLTGKHEGMHKVKDKNSMIIQFGWNLYDQFNQSHIEGAVYMDCQLIQDPTDWLLKTEQQVCNIFKKYQQNDLNIIAQLNNNILQKSTSNQNLIKKSVKTCQVIQQQKCKQYKTSLNKKCIKQEIKSMRYQKILFYNRNISQMSILPASRLAMLMLHHDVCLYSDILIQGYEGFQDSRKENMKVIRVSRIPVPNQQNQCGKHKIIIGYEQLQKQMANNKQLVDIRTLKQYQGESSGYSYWKLKGKIPNSIYHGGRQSKNSCEVKEYSYNGQFLKMWEQQNIKLNEPIILYCGSGWRASQVIVYAILNGIQDISLYSNGWIQWSKFNIKKTENQAQNTTESQNKNIQLSKIEHYGCKKLKVKSNQ